MNSRISGRRAAAFLCAASATAPVSMATQFRGVPAPAPSLWLSDPELKVFFQPRLFMRYQSVRVRAFSAVSQPLLKTSTRSQFVVQRAGFRATPLSESRST